MSGIGLLSEATVQALGWTLLHSLWQGLVVAAALAVTRVVTSSPRLRYLMACTALLTMVLLPLGTFLSHAADRPTGTTPARLAAISLGGAPEVETSAAVLAVAPHPRSAIPAYESWLTALTAGLQRNIPWIVQCWFAGVVVLSLRLLGGGWVSHRLKHTGTNPLTDRWQMRVRALARRQGVRQSVQVVTSTIAAVPMVVGVFRPIILVPVATFLGLTHHQLEAILIHELAHVRRHDTLVNLLQRLVEAVLFFHPAIWWVSSCVRTEREHCCDDTVAAGSDPKVYAAALATLEEIRSPALAATATGGPLLARIRRLLAVDGASVRGGLSSFTIPGLIGILVVLAGAAVTLEATQSTKQTEEEEMVSESQLTSGRKVLDIERTPRFTRLEGALHDMLQTAGRTEWTSARLQGVLGNAFSFEMRKGGGMVWQEGNLDWGLFFEEKPEFEPVSRIRRYQTRPGDGSATSSRVKAAAWKAVRASIDRGIPVAALCPMSPEEDAARDWGLLVGYDEADESYTIRRHGGEFTARYDAIGHAEFCVLVYEGPGPDVADSIHVAALQNAVAFARGRRYDPRGAAFDVDARGFAALELWREAIETGTEASPEQEHPGSDGIVRDSQYHAGELRALRGYAAAYLRELVELFPVAASELEKGAAQYDRVVEASGGLQAVFNGANEEGALGADARATASELIGSALEAERGAIASIEAALALMGESTVAAFAVEETQAATLTRENAMASASQAGGNEVRLDIEAEEVGGIFVGCLRPALRATSLDFSIDYLMGFLGTAFAFSMEEDGGHLHQAGNYEWSYFFDMLDFLEHEAIDASLYRIPDGGSGEPPPEPVVQEEEHTRAKAEAWEKVRRAIDEGVPAIAWQVMSPETKKAKQGAAPWLWSLIVGYDEKAGTYTVDHSSAGEFTIPWDGFGHSDPVNWFSVMIFRPPTEPFDARAANRVAIERAIESSQGKYPGDNAPAQGLAAWEMWLKAFQDGTVEVHPVSHHAGFLIRARSAATTYLRQVQAHFPASAGAPLEAAANSYDQVAAKMAELRDLCAGKDPDLQHGAEILSSALEEERAAIASLQQVLEAR